MMYLKMIKKSFTEVFFMSSMSNGREKQAVSEKKSEVIRAEKAEG